MAVPLLACPACDARNPADAARCARCGTELLTGGPHRWPARDAKDIARVRLGFLLAALGVALAWFHDMASASVFMAFTVDLRFALLALIGRVVGGVGVAILVVGVLLVLAGRRPFEYSVGGKSVAALFLVPTGAVLSLLVAGFLLGHAMEFAEGGDPYGVVWMFKSSLLWAFVLSVLTALGSLFLGFDLQDERGLRLSLVGVLAFVVPGLAGLAAGWLWMDALWAGAVARGAVDAAFFAGLGYALLPARFLDLAWRLVFSVVFVRTYRRIASGEIPVPPETVTPPAVPAARPG